LFSGAVVVGEEADGDEAPEGEDEDFHGDGVGTVAFRLLAEWAEMGRRLEIRD
jgi:hypothetical protein